jgi:hypothetical protein
MYLYHFPHARQGTQQGQEGGPREAVEMGWMDGWVVTRIIASIERVHLISTPSSSFLHFPLLRGICLFRSSGNGLFYSYALSSSSLTSFRMRSLAMGTPLRWVPHSMEIKIDGLKAEHWPS